jgi:hypothetical protein
MGSGLDDIRHTFGAQWQNPNGNVNVPYFYRNNGKRNLNLNWIDNEFNSNCRFLVSRQSLYSPAF